MAHEHRPQFELRVRTPRIELCYPDDGHVMTLADPAAADIHGASTMPFSFPWTNVAPRQLPRNTVQHLWRRRADWQEVYAVDFGVRAVVGTGSWLGLAHHGRGMRSAVLHFAFDVLGARRAESGAFVDDPASLAVSRRLGYRENGRDVVARRGEAAWLIGLALDRDDCLPRRRDDIEVAGLEPCRPVFGLPA